MWLMFLQANQKNERYSLRFLRLKANKKGTPDVFTAPIALGKVSLIHLEVKMSEIRLK